MTIMQWGIKTGHVCFHQHFCDTVETLKPPKTVIRLFSTLQQTCSYDRIGTPA